MITLTTIEISLLISLILVAVLMLFFAVFYFKAKDLNVKLIAKSKALIEQNSNLEDELLNNSKELATLNTTIALEQKSFEEKIELMQKQEQKLKSEFKNLANEILETTKNKMHQESTKSIKNLLNPLSSQLGEFKNKIEYLSKEEAKEISALQNELKNLKELSFKLSNEAHNLTTALKGENKQQGVWGEFVLTKTLELSGLKEGAEYKKEVTLKDTQNQIYRPDVIVYLPEQREVIIDAKTSLVAYKNYIEAENELKIGYLKAHVASIKRHIDILSEKKYEKLKGVNSLDFVFIFIPIENALMIALEADKNLFEYAFKKRVVLVSPTTLLVSLRAIETSWRYERQSKNIAEVIKNAESLYDKVRGFVEDFSKVGKSLDNAKASFEMAQNKLASGKGNVLRQIEMLKNRANIKPKKELPKEMLDSF